jgi:hypothetical protein
LEGDPELAGTYTAHDYGLGLHVRTGCGTTDASLGVIAALYRSAERYPAIGLWVELEDQSDRYVRAAGQYPLDAYVRTSVYVRASQTETSVALSGVLTLHESIEILVPADAQATVELAGAPIALTLEATADDVSLAGGLNLQRDPERDVRTTEFIDCIP